MFATLKRSRKFYDVEIVTRPHPILIIAECAKTSQPMEFDQTIFLATAKKSLARETIADASPAPAPPPKSSRVQSSISDAHAHDFLPRGGIRYSEVGRSCELRC